ncbi:MAG: tetratricopeptide repeat protein [Candidatus Hydrogenedentes bacterium]|nr:tetratricopeptide repeat protein [Candidatus Hydrogenedentota bacterium]
MRNTRYQNRFFTPTKVNLVLGVLVFCALIFGLRQSFQLQRLKIVAGPEVTRKALEPSSSGRWWVFPEPIAHETGEETSEATADALRTDKREKTSEDSGAPAKKADAAKKKSTGQETGGHRSSAAALEEEEGGIGYHNMETAAADTTRSNRRTPKKEQSKASDKRDRDDTVIDAAQLKVMVSEAQNLIRVGQYEDAEMLLQEVLDTDKSNQSAWNQLAYLQHKSGVIDQEIDTYEQWLEHNPTTATPYYKLANLYARMGEEDYARYYMGEYEARMNKDSNHYPMTAGIYRKLNDIDGEGRVLSQWLEATPDSVDAQQAWAEYNRRSGDFNAALNQYAALTDIMPNNPMPYRQMGDIYSRVGDYVSAQQYYETAVSLRANDVNTLTRLGNAYYQSGNYGEAIGVYNQVIAINPASTTAQNAQQRIYQIESEM